MSEAITKGICTKVEQRSNDYGQFFEILVREPLNDETDKKGVRKPAWARLKLFPSMARYGELIALVNMINNGLQPIIVDYAYKAYVPSAETLKKLKAAGRKPRKFINGDSGWKVSEKF